MTHQQIITEAYDRCEIVYVLRPSPSDPRYTYLILAGTEERKRQFEAADLDRLIAGQSFIEFFEGNLASY